MILEVISRYKNRFVYLGISLVLCLLIRENMFYTTILLVYCFYLFKNHRDMFLLLGIILLIYIVRIFFFHLNIIEPQSFYSIEVKSNIKIDEYTSFVGQVDNNLILVYFDGNIDVKPGEIYHVFGSLEKAISSTMPHGFDYQNYLKSRNIKYTIFSDQFELVSKKISLNAIPYHINQYIDKNCPKSKAYIKTFILADQSLIDSDTRNEIKNIGISHLFAVSGLHIALIVIVLEKFLSQLKIRKQYIEIIIILILVLYVIITGYASSITRAALMYIFLVINKRTNMKLSSLDILSIVFMLLIYVKPYNHYNIGFVLSFLVTFGIIVGKDLLKASTKVKQLFALSMLSFAITMPLIVNLNYQINLLSIIFNVMFLAYVSYIILPLGYITFVFPILDSLYHLFIGMFETIVHLVSRMDFFTISMYFSNPIHYILYYLLLMNLFIAIENKRLIQRGALLLFVWLCVIYFSPYFKLSQEVVFLDVQGDSTFIRDQFNQCNILIDTGEVDDYDSVIHYLKSQNIKRLDYVFISHFHSDHYGEIEDVMKEFKILNVVTNQNVSNYQSQMIACGNIDIYIYDMSYTDTNENNNSIIQSVFIANQHYLFVGDAEEIREEEFLSKYDITVDVLKVGHHGSNTSSSIEFLEAIKAKQAVMIVGRRNTFGHPHPEIVGRYEELNINLDRTDLKGTIIYRYFLGKVHKRVHSPS